jgi:hypothetical protein
MMFNVDDQNPNPWEPLTDAEVTLLAHMLRDNSFEWVTRLWHLILAQAKSVGEL